MIIVLFVSAMVFGYAVAVGLMLAATFGITSRARRFVAKDYRIRKRYKLTEELLWLICATVGGYITATISGRTLPWVSATFLIVVMMIVFWTNTWEMRQRGVAHQMLLSLASVVGVTAGFLLRLR